MPSMEPEHMCWTWEFLPWKPELICLRGCIRTCRVVHMPVMIREHMRYQRPVPTLTWGRLSPWLSSATSYNQQEI
jgi:hypothetical protein